ncbi:MAG: MmcQ/YjbR family DNA-binding protein [Oscillospiraceae bacterium]|nr:MmcQ/YjbR family DNA-binding protein [Oscillospiraceae bacterium]
MTKPELVSYVRDYYSVNPDYPWDDENYVLRHESNRKWFAVGLAVRYLRLGIDCDGTVDIIDVKCSPLMMGAYLSLPGILPGYHMNKDHWLTILLDGTASDETIKELLEISYEMTKGMRR